MVKARLEGTVLLGGMESAIVSLDSGSVLQMLRPDPGQRLERGQRFLLQGDCILEGTNLMAEPTPLVDNDGVHSLLEKSAGIWLEAGKQPIRVRYFNQADGRGLNVSVQALFQPVQPIPDSLLFHCETNSGTGAVEWKPGVRYKCYDGEWSRMPEMERLPCFKSGVASNFDIAAGGRTTNYGMDFAGFLEVQRAGWYVVASASDDGSCVDVGRPRESIQVIGSTNLAALPQLAAGQSISEGQDEFCAAMDGVVRFASRDASGLKLELGSGRGRALVTVPSRGGADPQWFIGTRVRVCGICQRVFAPEGYPVAGRLAALSQEQVELLDVPQRLWNAYPLTALGQLSAEKTPGIEGGARPVHVAGTVVGEAGSRRWWLEDNTGRVLLDRPEGGALRAGLQAEVLGSCGLVDTNVAILGGLCRAWSDKLHGGVAEKLPLLTTIEQIKQMSREEAMRGYPVSVRGVITFVWPDAGFFLQDATSSIDVRMAPSVTTTVPQVGECWEVEGKTFAEFAPNIRATRGGRLGPGTLPAVVHPNWGQLVDGSLDAQYVEVEGVVSRAQGNMLSLLTRDGYVTAQLPEFSAGALLRYEGALVRVHGCLIPGRDVVTQQVLFGEFALRNASVAVDEPAPPDPFLLPLRHATDLLLFDSHASPIQRVKLEGVLLQNRDGVCYLMDGANGLRVLPKAAEALRMGEKKSPQPGDRLEVVGFPDMSGPSPLLRDALLRRVGVAGVPPARRLPPESVLDGRLDSTMVETEATLVSLPSSHAEQMLEMRSGARIWMAHLPFHAGALPPLVPGCELNLKGVYVGRGGDRASGQGIESFELLLHSPADLVVLRRPSWWTASHALAVAEGLSAVLLLTLVWIGTLRRRVDMRTAELKQEISAHERTELELNEKTRQLTREIEERVRMEAEIERGHKQLLVTSRLAGMAEVATSVLHNVGNVMTNVNVLSGSIVEHVRNSKAASVARLGELLGDHRSNLPSFLTEDERGRKVPDFVQRVGARLVEEQSELLHKVKALNDSIEHINEIVAMQQGYAKASSLLETVAPQEVIEDALRMHGESLKRHGIRLVRDFAPVPAMTMDRHKILQILFNLLENAKYACLQAYSAESRVMVTLRPVPSGLIQISVADNGMGIAAENLTRMFAQGFSTRKGGHGFGLHSSVLAAQEMGGKLAVSSDGVGKGATFTLEIPSAPKPAGAGTGATPA